MDIQALFDGMSAQWMRERANTQMTLGKLIEALEAMPSDQQIDGIREPHSYRGYYSDLAFELEGTTTAGEALAMCRSCMGQVFKGYKGGDFVMGALTPVWIADYGCCGTRIMDIEASTGAIITADEE